MFSDKLFVWTVSYKMQCVLSFSTEDFLDLSLSGPNRRWGEIRTMRMSQNLKPEFPNCGYEVRNPPDINLTCRYLSFENNLRLQKYRLVAKLSYNTCKQNEHGRSFQDHVTWLSYPRKLRFLVPSPNLSFLVTLQNHFLSYVTLLFFLFVVPTFDAKSSSWPRLIVSHPLQSCFPPQPWPCYCSPLTCVTTTSARSNPFLVSHVTGWRFSSFLGFFFTSLLPLTVLMLSSRCVWLMTYLPSFYFDVYRDRNWTGTDVYLL